MHALLLLFEESDMTERLHFHFSLSCIGEGNGNPLQCSCLENPRDGGAWWTAIYGVAQSQTRLKGLSNSSRVTLFCSKRCLISPNVVTNLLSHHCLLNGPFLPPLLQCHSAAAAAKLLQLCPTLCDPIDGSPPGSSIPGILQARTLERVAISFSNA